MKCAPAFFQREINQLLTDNGLAHSRGFVDDLLSGGDTWEAYLQAQKELLQTLRDSNWLVTVNKVRLGYTELHTLGHVVGHGYIKPDMAKVEAL